MLQEIPISCCIKIMSPAENHNIFFVANNFFPALFSMAHFKKIIGDVC